MFILEISPPVHAVTVSKNLVYPEFRQDAAMSTITVLLTLRDVLTMYISHSRTSMFGSFRRYIELSTR